MSLNHQNDLKKKKKRFQGRKLHSAVPKYSITFFLWSFMSLFCCYSSTCITLHRTIHPLKKKSLAHNVSKHGPYLSLAAAVSSYLPRGNQDCRQAASSVCSSAPPLCLSVEPALKAEPAGRQQRGAQID